MISTAISGILANHEISGFLENRKQRKNEMLEAQSGLAVSEAELYESMRCCQGSESNYIKNFLT